MSWELNRQRYSKMNLGIQFWKVIGNYVWERYSGEYFEGDRMVIASIAFYFASTSSDHFCLASSEHFRNSNPFSISHVVLVTCYSYENGIISLLYFPFSTLKG